MKIVREIFGEIDGKDVYSFTLTNEGIEVCLIEYGAAVKSIIVQGREKQPVSVALGLETLEDYQKNIFFLGAICGRHANRIEDAEFQLNGLSYSLEKNDGDNSLHSGANGFHSHVFAGREIVNGVEFSLRSEAFDQGFPGNVDFVVTYTLTQENGLRISYRAVSDADTVCNPTSHAYFNLESGGSVLDHTLTIEADFYTPVTPDAIPTGEILSVAGTPFDFTSERRIGQAIEEQISPVEAGYDHNFVLRGSGPRRIATIAAPNSGVVMEVLSDLPGLQFYSGNFLTGYSYPNGNPGGKHSGFCLETQYFPNSLRYSHFPQPILRAGEVFESFTEYRFSAR